MASIYSESRFPRNQPPVGHSRSSLPSTVRAMSFSTECWAASAPRTCSPTLGRFRGAEDPEGERPAQRPFLLHDEMIVHAERLQLGGLLLRAGAAALRRNEHPPAPRPLGAGR